MDGMINGQPVHFAFDTGADGTALFRKSALRLGLKIIKDPEPPKPGEIVSDVTEECTFSYGGATQHGRFAVIDSPNFPLDIDGVFSWVGWSNHIVSIDFERKALQVSRTLPGDLQGWAKWRVLSNANVLVFECPGSSGVARIGIDTGDPNGVSLSEARWNQWRLAHTNPPPSLNAIWNPQSGLFVRELFRASNLTLGGLAFTDVPVMPAEPSLIKGFKNADALLGLTALYQVKIVLDVNERLLYMSPNAHSSANYPYSCLGAVFAPKSMEAGDDLVAHVAAGSVAYRAGIRDGDVLLRVGDRDTTKWRTDPDVLPLLKRLLAQPGTQLLLMLKRGDKTYQARVSLAEVRAE